MTVPEELDILHGTFPSCGTLAYADLAAGMVLVANSRSNLDRHALDALCAEAGCLLGDAAAVPLGGRPAAFALVRGPDRLLLAFRSPDQPSDALLCLAKPDLEVAAFQKEAQECLARICAET